jgi:Ca2+-binding EF-hand superfamily protein
MNYVQLDISGISVGAMGCFTSRSEGPTTGLILLKIITAISVPFVVSLCIVAWRNYKLNKAMRFQKRFSEGIVQQTRVERDLQLASLPVEDLSDLASLPGKDSSKLTSLPGEDSSNDTHILNAMIALLDDREHPQDFRSFLHKDEAELTMRLFNTYDDSGDENVCEKELRLFLDDLGFNIDDNQMDVLIDAVLMHDCARHDSTPETAAELVAYLAKQKSSKSNRIHRVTSFKWEDGSTFDVEETDEINKFDADTHAHLMSEDFLIMLGVYRQVLVADMTEEEADAFELYPKGSPAWLHDYSLRATGKMVS